MTCSVPKQGRELKVVCTLQHPRSVLKRGMHGHPGGPTVVPEGEAGYAGDKTITQITP